MSFHTDLKLFTGLTMLGWSQPWWIPYNTTMTSFQECWKPKLSYCGPQVNGLSSILWLVVIASLCSIVPLLISHFEYGHFTLAQTIENLKIELWMKACQLPVLNSWKLYVWALHLISKGPQYTYPVFKFQWRQWKDLCCSFLGTTLPCRCWHCVVVLAGSKSDSSRANGLWEELSGANVTGLGCTRRLETNLCRSRHRSGLYYSSWDCLCNTCWDAHPSYWRRTTWSASSILLWTHYSKVGLLILYMCILLAIQLSSRYIEVWSFSRWTMQCSAVPHLTSYVNRYGGRFECIVTCKRLSSITIRTSKVDGWCA